METIKGKLVKAKKGKGWRVAFEGVSNDHAISGAAKFFSDKDAEDGMEVDVELEINKKGKPIYAAPKRVTIPGKTVVQASGNSASSPNADPKVLGQPFHNPYTFIPFHLEHPTRSLSTPLTADELEGEQQRYTGVLSLKVKTESPLLTCNPVESSIEENSGHKSYDALRIGNDVIVPATGVRGALRSLMTILTGGSLTYVNEHAYLCQGRDVPLGPRTPYNQDLPKNVFLAEVVRPGTLIQAGTIRLGETRRVKMVDLHEKIGKSIIDTHRKPGSRAFYVALDQNDKPTSHSNAPSEETPWKVKLSGKPVGSPDRIKGKYEGAFKPGDSVIQLPCKLWAAYISRNANGTRPELQEGDLIWLEPVDKDKEADSITGEKEIKSIQWARWGKQGKALVDCLPEQALPDYLSTAISEVTDLFGMVDPAHGKSNDFSGRIRPENLVFQDGKIDKKVSLAPLLAPHLGCVAFYRDNDDPDKIGKHNELRGYKVYRTSDQRGDKSPWLYETQSLFKDSGAINDKKKQSVNKTCDLLPEGQSGTLRIAFRALSKRELALLIQACHVPWRLGGGKPLGLGLCSISEPQLIDVNGDAFSLEDWQAEVKDIKGRVDIWQKSQLPIDMLRYPRAVEKNQNKNVRGGHAWFGRHAEVKKGQAAVGLQPLYLAGEALAEVESQGQSLDPARPMISAQILPFFDPEDPAADVLFGYDLLGTEVDWNEKPRELKQCKVFSKLEVFDTSEHVTGTERSHGNTSPNAETRKSQKNRRRGGRN